MGSPARNQTHTPCIERWSLNHRNTREVPSSAYLAYMQSTSCKMLGWMSYKLESRLLGAISTTSDIQMIPRGRKRRGTKEPPDEGERGEWKSWPKTHIQKLKIMASDPITSWQIDEETMKQWQILFSWAPKSLWMVTADMKLDDACFLERRLWQTRERIKSMDQQRSM